jgi:hypothetical protein
MTTETYTREQILEIFDRPLPPAPFVVHGLPGKLGPDLFIVDANGVGLWDQSGSMDSAAAAFLFAASPDLRDALRWAMGYLPQPLPIAGDVHDEYSRQHAAARAALRKSEGNT